MQVPVETRYSYSPATRHDQQVAEEDTVNDVIVERKTVPVQRPTKYVKIPAAKIPKVRSTK